MSQLEAEPPRYIIGKVLRWEFARNSGAAFSSFTGATFLLTFISISVLIYLFIQMPKVSIRTWSLPWGGLTGGILGNLTDRIFRAPAPFRGHVVDWIGLPNWALFNIADTAIVLSVLAMAILSWRGSTFRGGEQ